MSIKIMPCRLTHAAAVANNLRWEEMVECAIAGILPRHMIRMLRRQSVHLQRVGPGDDDLVDYGFCRAAVFNGEAIAIWGDAAPPISTEGHMWLFTTHAIDKMPITFFRVTRRQVAERLQARETLRTSVLGSSFRSCRFWQMLGFTIGDQDERGLCEARIGRVS